MHITKRDNGFRFQESRTRQVINFLAMTTGILMAIGGIFLGSYYEHWLKGLWVAFGGALVVVATLLRLSTQTELNGRDTQGRTRGQALMDFWREKGFFATYPPEHFGDRSNWVALKDSTEECRLYVHNSGLMVTVRNEKVRIGNPGSQHYEAFTFAEDTAREKQVHVWLIRCLVLRFKDGTEVLRVATRQDGQLDIARARYFPPEVLCEVLDTHCRSTLRRMMPARAIDKLIATVPLGILESGESLPDGDIGVPGSEVRVLSPA